MEAVKPRSLCATLIEVKWPNRPVDEIDNVKPISGMKKRHEVIKDATNGRSGTDWGGIKPSS